MCIIVTNSPFRAGRQFASCPHPAIRFKNPVRLFHQSGGTSLADDFDNEVRLGKHGDVAAAGSPDCAL
jgi:hypothetical protein